MLALYRILYIKAQNWVKNKVGEKRLLLIFLIVGLLFHGAVSYFVFLVDDESVMAKMCNHQTEEEIEILRDYNVTNLFLFVVQLK